MPPTSSSARAALRLGDFTTDKRVVLLMGLAVPVGLASVVAAWVLLRLIALCTNLAYHGQFSFADQPIATGHLGLASVAIPVAGCLIIGLMARYGSEKIRGHGIPEAMEAILIGKSRIQPKVAILKPVSSAISIGTGGPFGAEGPIIMTGGAIGSLLAQTIHLDDGERKTLLVAGAAAGMTAIFSTPLAAVLLAVELLLFEWKPRSFLPVAMAALVAAAARAYVLDAGPIFAYSGALPFTPAHLLACAAVGVLAGLGSGVLTSMVYAAEDLFEKLPLHWMWWPAFGGLAIGIGGLIDPAALGVGYDNIRHLLAGDLAFQAVLLLLVVKVLIWSIAL
ncbi:MAG: chloride channel protein, partial [Achromobacter veterisilvae]